MDYHDENINDRIMLPILKMPYQYFVVSYMNESDMKM